MSPTRPSNERFWEKVEKTDGCWLWTGGRFTNGYGAFRPGVNHPSESSYAHVWCWESAYGSKPEGMQLDHTCMVKHCVNPAHLRLVTNKQNCEHRAGWASNQYRGSNFHPKTGKWQARVGHAGRQEHLGLYDTPEEAAEVARARRNELFTHNDLDRRAV